MNRFTKQTVVGLFLAIILSLTACDNQPITETPVVSDDIQPSATISVVSTADNKFTVRYSADSSFNPITGTDPINMALIPLMYEGLFVLDNSLAAQPVLCDTYETSDGRNYTFHLKPDIAMSDGSTLEAQDVKYSLSQATQQGRFSGRLNNLESIVVVDSLTLQITLSSVNYKLPVLLDIPIIKYNSIDFNYPPGTGPYIYVDSMAARLSAAQDHRALSSLPVPVIYLKDCTNIELSVAFSSQDIDLFWDDPGDSSEINILSDHEVRYYNTTILQLVGFNTKTSVLSNPEFRRALGLAVDRDHIVKNIYSSYAIAAPLALSPNYTLYDTTWENHAQDSLTEISSIFASLDMKDDDSNGYLEYPASNGGYQPFSLTFIVNGDNKYKVAAAEEITSSLKAIGIDVNLKKLSWSAYMSALENENFDLYYADVSLPPDYDLTELLSAGGALDYGQIGHASYSSYIDAFLSAFDYDAETTAAGQLCSYVYENAPFIPVLYRKYAVHTNRNTVSGLDPTQSSLFFELFDWTITLG